MSRGGSVRAFALVLVLVFAAALALASVAPPTPQGPRPPIGIGKADTDKNCYLPGEEITFTLTNVGTGPLLYSWVPDFEVENDTLGTVRTIVSGFEQRNVVLLSNESMSWTWDQTWVLPGGMKKGEFVPSADYSVVIQTLAGLGQPERVIIATHEFGIGQCVAQITAGDDLVVDEGQTFRFAPVIRITGDAEVTSVTWDLDPNVDGNGDGNLTNDIDLVGERPEFAFGDDGVYNVTMNLRGFGRVESKTRVDQDVVFAIDSSGSMETADPNGMRRVATKTYVDRMVVDDRGAVVDFDDTAHVVNGDHLSSDYERIKANIDLIDSAGGTYIAHALFVSSWELRDYGNAASAWIIIMLTDGESTVPQDVFHIPLATQFAKDLGIRVYTIGLRVQEQQFEDLLRGIANETGGRYFPALNADALRTIYEDIAEDANQTEGRYFVVQDSVTVSVRNVAPTVAIEQTSAASANVTLRVAGEKWHDVTLTVDANGTEVGNVSIVRMPGSPDNQTATIGTVAFAPNTSYTARVVYSPLDDPVNGQVWGANPVWILLDLSNGTRVELHHTFNVRHNETWVWEVPDVQTVATGGAVALAATITDPGSDDITVTWDWGDGTVTTRTYFFGAGPDPYPSPELGPVAVADIAIHAYAAPGTYTVTLTVEDDDGGQTVLTFDVGV